MWGGRNDDFYFIDNIGDVVIESGGEGLDRVQATLDFVLPNQVENLVMRGAARLGTGNVWANAIWGSGGADVIAGLKGDDQLHGNDGNDVLRGGRGADVVAGGRGSDELSGNDGDDLLVGGSNSDSLAGGSGSDTFAFADGEMGTSTTAADRIKDFSQADGDRIDLGLVDADATLAADQAFAFIGSGAFTGVAGQLHYLQAGGNTFVEGDTDGDGSADFVIRLDGLVSLAAGDFVL
jgi:Ca2+-binding RTX toxin-like protein